MADSIRHEPIESKLGMVADVTDNVISNSKPLDPDNCAIACVVREMFGDLYEKIVVSGVSIILANDEYVQNWHKIRLGDKIRDWVHCFDTGARPAEPFKMRLIKDERLMHLYCFEMMEEKQCVSGMQLEMF